MKTKNSRLHVVDVERSHGFGPDIPAVRFRLLQDGRESCIYSLDKLPSWMRVGQRLKIRFSNNKPTRRKFVYVLLIVPHTLLHEWYVFRSIGDSISKIGSTVICPDITEHLNPNLPIYVTFQRIRKGA